MILTEIITHLRESCPIFERRISGQQAFVAADARNASIPVPCAFVVPLFDNATALDGTYSQKMTESYAVIVALDNSRDKKDGQGMSAQLQLEMARTQLNGAIIGFESKVFPSLDQSQYVRGQHLFMNNALLWHQFQYSYQYYVQANLDANSVFTQIEKLLDGYFPEIDPHIIKKILVTGGVAPITTNGDPTKYHEVLSILTDTRTEDWLTRLPGPSKDPGYVSEAMILKPKPGTVNMPDKPQGNFDP